MNKIKYFLFLIPMLAFADPPTEEQIQQQQLAIHAFIVEKQERDAKFNPRGYIPPMMMPALGDPQHRLKPILDDPVVIEEAK